MTKGFLIVAQNSGSVDYIACARVLAKSLKLTNSQYPVTLLTDRLDYPGLDIFDTTLTFPFGDHSSSDWKLENDWQCYFASQYDETIKLEADVIVTRSLDSWWELCKNHDLMIATGCRTFRGDIATSRYYRKLLDRNGLPDAYNGITYFKRSELASEFFGRVKFYTENWTIAQSRLNTDEPFNTDTAYALSTSDIEVPCTSNANFMQWAHMKQYINNLRSEDWTQDLVWELIGTDFRINTVSQLYPVHYHVKELAKLLEPLYDRQLEI